MASLYYLVDEYREAIDALLSDDLPPEAIADTLEGLQGELESKALNVAAYIANLESDASQYKTAYTKMKTRETVALNKVVRLKTYLKDCLNKLDIKTLQNDELTLKLTTPRQSVVITNEELLPESLIKWVSSPDKSGIKKLLESGTEVDGATLEFGESSVSIR